ncbi:MAG: hypothetical protein CVV01_01205, partial [Firmicutes bacterium HGW-Firmicutes-6]
DPTLLQTKRIPVRPLTKDEITSNACRSHKIGPGIFFQFLVFFNLFLNLKWGIMILSHRDKSEHVSERRVILCQIN